MKRKRKTEKCDCCGGSAHRKLADLQGSEWDEWVDEVLRDVVPNLSLAHAVGEQLTIIEAHSILVQTFKAKGWTFQETYSDLTKTYLLRVMDQTGEVVRTVKAEPMHSMRFPG